MSSGSREERLALLRHDEEETRIYREARLAFLMELHGRDDHIIFQGGELAALSFDECRRAFLDGLFLATVSLAQMCIEKSLVGMGRSAGDDVEKLSGMKELTRYGVQKGLLTASEAAQLDKLRALRNPLSHGRAPLARDSLERRALASDQTTYGVLGEDARTALRILYAFLERARFPS